MTRRDTRVGATGPSRDVEVGSLRCSVTRVSEMRCAGCFCFRRRIIAVVTAGRSGYRSEDWSHITMADFIAPPPPVERRDRAVYAEILEGRGDLVGANRQLKMALAALGTTSTSVVEARTATA